MILSCDVHPAPDHVLVVVSGPLDLDSGPVLRETLRDLDTTLPKPVVIDLDRVPFIDSAGLSVLISAMKRLRENGCEMRLVGSTAFLIRIMRITGVWKVMPLFATVEDALGDASPTLIPHQGARPA